jgi:FixJ family two-component response regulator
MNTPDGTLFVVDDESSARRGVAALASSLGISCEMYASAEEFLDRHAPSRPGCVLADQRLAGISGLELQARLTDLGSTLPFILISAYANVAMAVQAMQNGAVTVLQKPCEADALTDAVRKAMAIDAEGRAAAYRRRDVSKRLAGLTLREHRVMELLVAGEPQKVIARRLEISLRTTARLCASVLDRMGVDNAMALIRRLTGTPLPAALTEDAARGQTDEADPGSSNGPPSPGRFFRAEDASPIDPPFHQGRLGRLFD